PRWLRPGRPRPSSGCGRARYTSATLPFQHAHGFLDADLLGGEAVENLAPVGAAVALGGAAEGGDDLIEAGASGVVGDLQLGGELLDVAAVLDHQLDEIELLGGEPADPAEAELTLDH